MNRDNDYSNCSCLTTSGSISHQVSLLCGQLEAQRTSATGLPEVSWAVTELRCAAIAPPLLLPPSQRLW